MSPTTIVGATCAIGTFVEATAEPDAVGSGRTGQPVGDDDRLLGAGRDDGGEQTRGDLDPLTGSTSSAGPGGRRTSSDEHARHRRGPRPRPGVVRGTERDRDELPAAIRARTYRSTNSVAVPSGLTRKAEYP